MINNLINYFKDKKIIILGFGREGQSSYRLIRRYLKEQTLYIADKNEHFQKNFDFLSNDNNLEFISGENYLDDLNNYDIILKSPGISFANIDTIEFHDKIKSQLELVLEFFDFFTIGITGTKGKSTTSSLIYHILKNQNVKCKLLGNIGIPIFDFVDTLDDDMTIILEMSSHQLEYANLSPNIAILLNAYEEHLDHYTSFEKYVEAKCNIYKYQTEKDYFLYNCDNETLGKFVNKTNSQTYKVSIKNNANSDIFLKDDKVYFKNKEIYDINMPRNLLGDYNVNNIMFALGVSEILNLDIAKTIESISDFKTLEHRLELVGIYDEVYYYDNSIGTIPMATIEAVKALKNVDSLIIGGMDRGLDYSEFIEFLNSSDISNIICMPKTGHDIARYLKEGKFHIVDTLEEAVLVAKKVTKKGKICLLSPAAASYGFFKNFEEKGNKFKELVKI